jgi:hypothetical protein
MAALQTVLPFKLAATDESLTAHSGLALVGEYLRAMGVVGLIDHPKNCSWQIFEGMRIAYSQWHDARSCSLSPSPDG